MSEPFYVYVGGAISGMPSDYLANVARISFECRYLIEHGFTPLNTSADLLEGLMSSLPLPLELYRARSLDLLRLLEGRRGCFYVTAFNARDGSISTGVAEEEIECRRLHIPIVGSRFELGLWRDEVSTPEERGKAMLR